MATWWVVHLPCDTAKWCEHHDSYMTNTLMSTSWLLQDSCTADTMPHTSIICTHRFVGSVMHTFQHDAFCVIDTRDMTLSCPSLWYDSFMSIALWPAMFVTLSAAHSCTAASRVTLSVFYTCMNESCPIDKWVMSLTHMHIRARLRLVPLSLSSIIDPPKETGPQVLCTISTFCTRVYNDIWRMCIFVYTDPLSGYFSRTWFSCSDMHEVFLGQS